MTNRDPIRARGFQAIVRLGGLAIALGACSPSFAGSSTAGTITATAAYSAARHGDAILIDVREAGEIEQGAPAATTARIVYRLDHSRDVEFVDETVLAVSGDRNVSIVLMCAAGVRSAVARDLLLTRGFTHVRSLDGGFRSWQASRLPMARPASSQTSRAER
jgi:rhodanese-related sulfurtransferase